MNGRKGNNRLWKFISLILILGILAACLLMMGCQKKELPLKLTLEEYPIVDGSTVTIPLSEALAAKITDKTLEEIRPYVVHNKTHEAYVNLIDKKADLIFVTGPSEEELALAKEKNVELEIVPIVSEGFVFITHVDNPVNQLTVEQIQDIYTGKITNWKEVGGEDLPIIAYQRPEN